MKKIRDFVEGKVMTFNGMRCYLHVGLYPNSRIYLELRSCESGAFVSRLTFDMSNVPVIDEMVILKSYLDNDGVYELLLRENIILPCERKISIGNHFGLICFLNIPKHD